MIGAMRCAATTAAGAPCRNAAMQGADLCVSHLRIVGRKTILSEAMTDQLVSMLRAGVPVRTAIATVNLGKSAFYEWMASEEPMFRRFAERVREAEALGKAALVTRIAGASREKWEAAAWLLERSYPEEFARISQRALAPAPEKPADPFAEFTGDELAA